jgi:hypothetical protein
MLDLLARIVDAFDLQLEIDERKHIRIFELSSSGPEELRPVDPRE